MDACGHLLGQKVECGLPVFKASDRIGLERIIVHLVNFEVTESRVSPEYFVCFLILATDIHGYNEPVFHRNPVGY